MLWLNHPRFVRVREETLQAVQKHEYRFRRTPNVIFLCGGIGSRPRERLAEFLRKKDEEDTLLFYAEEVWIAISRSEELSALEMEAKL
jgi:hypothetical protein